MKTVRHSRNLLRAAGLEKGGALGRSWGDGDCYLVLETASRLYAYQPDDYLKSKLDYWIPIIARIQREDGRVDTWTYLERLRRKQRQAVAASGGQVRKGPFQGALHYNMGASMWPQRPINVSRVIPAC